MEEIYLSKFLEQCAEYPYGLCDRFSPESFVSKEEAEAYLLKKKNPDLCIFPAKCATDKDTLERLKKMGIRHIETLYYVGKAIHDSRGNAICEGDKLYVKGHKEDRFAGTVDSIFQGLGLYFLEEKYYNKIGTVPAKIGFISRTSVILNLPKIFPFDNPIANFNFKTPEVYPEQQINFQKQRVLEISDLQKYYYKK